MQYTRSISSSHLIVDSHGLSDVGIGNVLRLEDLCPEACQLMAVVDLNDMELLKNAAVELELVVLEAGKDLAAEVDAHNIVQLLLGDEIALVPLQVVLDLVDVTRVLEQSSHGFLAGLDVLDISLGSSDLLNHSLVASLDVLQLR